MKFIFVCIVTLLILEKFFTELKCRCCVLCYNNKIPSVALDTCIKLTAVPFQFTGFLFSETLMYIPTKKPDQKLHIIVIISFFLYISFYKMNYFNLHLNIVFIVIITLHHFLISSNTKFLCKPQFCKHHIQCQKPCSFGCPVCTTSSD